MLKRSPVYLRVTEEGGKFDALDQLHDEPKPTEKLYCYVIHGTPGWCHILHRDRKRSGFYVSAEYAFVEPQPTDAEMRETSAWREWTSKQPHPFKT